MILLIRDNECFEPRVKNYIHFFKTHNISYRVIAWNRNGTAKPDDRITYYQKQAEYGKRIANIPCKIGWMLFVMKEIWRNRKECHAIHACDIDGILPALFIGKLCRKKVIFDIFDWISSLTGKGIVYRCVEWLQNFCYKHSDAVILCEEERKEQAKTTNDNILVIPNIPDAKTTFDEETLKKTKADLQSYDHVVSYVGVFDRDRGLENLLKVVSKCPNVKLNIAGFGVLDELIRNYAEKFENITCWGRVEYTVGQAIQKNSSMISAMYHLTSPLHKYAAPNKYYESLVLGVPMITTENTLVGSKVEKYDTGFVLDEQEESLFNLFQDETLQEKIEIKQKNCGVTWNHVYKDYYEDYMTERYINLIKRVDTKNETE